MEKNKRVIALIDMDCFYVQVEQRCKPELLGKPTAVVQYNQWKKGGIIAVGYEARDQGVKRGMRGEEALAVCPDINLVSVPTQREKADLTKYRQASEEVFKTISSFDRITIERASIDEAYLDLTVVVEKEYETNFTPFSIVIDDFSSSFLAVEDGDSFDNWLKNAQKENHIDDIKLALGARLVEKIRRKILDETKFHCSAGIAENKMLAKLVCCLHKPKQQTVIPSSLINELFKTTAIENVRLLGGKLGANVIETLGISTMAELAMVSLPTLQEHFNDSTARWLHDLSVGHDCETVVARQLPKSIGCSKNFPGKNALCTKKEINHWLKQLSEELEERLNRDQAANHRVARSFTVGIRTESDSSSVNCTRQTSLSLYSSDAFVKDATKLLQEFNSASKESAFWKPPITCLSLGAAKFEDCVDVEMVQITEYFKPIIATTAIETSRNQTPEKSESSAVDVQRLDSENKISSINGGLNSFFVKLSTDRESAHKQSAEKPRDSGLPTNQHSTMNQIQTKRILLTSDDDVNEYVAEKPSVIDNDEFKVNAEDRQTPLSCSGSDDLFEKQNAGGSRIDTSSPSILLDKKHNDKPQNIAEIWLDLPERRSDIDDEMWRHLPSDIRFELTQFYKKSEPLESQSNASSTSKKNKRPVPNTANKSASKSLATKSKKSNKSIDNGTTLLDFYNKL